MNDDLDELFDATGEANDFDPHFEAALGHRVEMRDEIIEALTADNNRLREELANVLGHVDTPISRRRLGFDPDTCVWLLSARAALKGEQK